MTLTIRHFFLIAAFGLLSACSSEYVDETDRWDEIQLYKEARGALTRGEFNRAVSRLETLEARYPFGEYAQQGQLDLMYAYYKSGQSDDAISTARRFIRLNPTHDRRDYVHYIEGIAEFERNRSFIERWFPRDLARYEQPVLQRSFDAFNEVVKRYPNSPYAADARQRMIFLRNKMAESCIHTANWNLRRTAYLAASKRAQECITRFNGAPNINEAVAIMVEGYQQLGFDDLAATAERMLVPVEQPQAEEE